MPKPHVHASRSAQKWGGLPEDYAEIHEWFDATKQCMSDVRHRALRHHAQGIFAAEEIFGLREQVRRGLARRPTTIVNSAGREVSIRDIGEQHVLDDLGWVPTVQDWLSGLPLKRWMASTGERPDRPWAEPVVAPAADELLLD